MNRKKSGKKMTLKAYERTPEDKRADKKEAKKRGMSLKAWEKSSADAKLDAMAVRKINKGRGK